jgi:hypothetical protein
MPDVGVTERGQGRSQETSPGGFYLVRREGLEPPTRGLRDQSRPSHRTFRRRMRPRGRLPSQLSPAQRPMRPNGRVFAYGGRAPAEHPGPCIIRASHAILNLRGPHRAHACAHARGPRPRMLQIAAPLPRDQLEHRRWSTHGSPTPFSPSHSRRPVVRCRTHRAAGAGNQTPVQARCTPSSQKPLLNGTDSGSSNSCLFTVTIDRDSLVAPDRPPEQLTFTDTPTSAVCPGPVQPAAFVATQHKVGPIEEHVLNIDPLWPCVDDHDVTRQGDDRFRITGRLVSGIRCSLPRDRSRERQDSDRRLLGLSQRQRTYRQASLAAW